jgi:O-antigen ligase
LHSHFPFRTFGITKGLDELNFMMPYILTFFSVEIIFRFLNKSSLIKISNSFLSILLLIVLFSLYVQAKRNGIISIIFMIISSIFFIKLVSNQITKKVIVFVLIGVFIGGSLLFFNIKEDKRWNKVSKSFNIVFIQNNMSFLKHKVPNGLDTSNYERMIYFREGIKILINEPLGHGYGRGIFGKILSKKYDVNIHTHAHSGMIDWGVGIGIPGLLLWSLIIFLLVYIGFKDFIVNESYFGLFLVYLSTSFYFRNFLDSMNKDHMFQQFIFLASLSLFAIYKEKYEKNNLPSS